MKGIIAAVAETGYATEAVEIVFSLSLAIVPRPFPLSVFDCLPNANTAGEDLEDLVMCGAIR